MQRKLGYKQVASSGDWDLFTCVDNFGVSAKKYNLYVGGSFEGTRLNRLYEELIDAGELADRIAELIDIYHLNKRPGERFGDFCNRVGVEKLKELGIKIYEEHRRVV